MARRAFVMGSNGPADADPLRFARKDAIRVAEVLAGPRCGFVVETPRPDADHWEALRQMRAAAASCSPGDAFLCYFSGHGVAPAMNLHLLWDDTRRDDPFNTSIPANYVIDAMKHCRARSRLTVLDCCQAGAIVRAQGWMSASVVPIEQMLQPENHLMLTASDHFQSARELDEFEGSFLTTNLCAALDERQAEVDLDEDGQVSVHELARWLGERAEEHNTRYPDLTVPTPRLFGESAGELLLTLGPSAWTPVELPWPDGSTMVVLPHLVNDDRALCIGKHPVVNAQYRRFVESGGGKEPEGRHFRDGEWRGPFYPWRDPSFSDPSQPVVCVSVRDAEEYCRWVNQLFTPEPVTTHGLESPESHMWFDPYPDPMFPTRLPAPWEWDYAAYGTEDPGRTRRDRCLARSGQVHQKASAPAPIDSTGGRSNERGVSDLFGNVWEWCVPEASAWEDQMAGVGSVDFGVRVRPQDRSELRGGGFRNDLAKIEPSLPADMTPDEHLTRHSDIGFRIAGEVAVDDLPKEAQSRLAFETPRSARFRPYWR